MIRSSHWHCISSCPISKVSDIDVMKRRYRTWSTTHNGYIVPNIMIEHPQFRLSRFSSLHDIESSLSKSESSSSISKILSTLKMVYTLQYQRCSFNILEGPGVRLLSYWMYTSGTLRYYYIIVLLWYHSFDFEISWLISCLWYHRYDIIYDIIVHHSTNYDLSVCFLPMVS